MSMSNLQGRAAWVFKEDDFDIDLIVGIKNIKITDIHELAAVTMTSYDPDFAKSVKKGDLLVGGHNFGYGHPHYPAMRAMRHLGVAGVIAESFSPGFFRGEISMGFPLVTCPGIREIATRWDELKVDWEASTVTNVGSGRQLPFERLSSVERGTLEAGGFIPYLKARLAKQGEPSSVAPSAA
ncbi:MULTISPECIES: 3-isopropylmalate dehydratase [unclassified Variovorax]|jgi:3-isopropylmalate/(R)-2-methylmalate dehydratase small subunit|uniref:LeuD/DmdB family oxidoreductase small subunit n=1 Tax=unclassified Variovorax TaxID=663243 RepID=UPI0008AFD2F8|nr:MULTISPECIES: 3-isopropylmalate dehydratase [unclassified Variovorax]SEJ80274.1 3-isopropylmalate dehydratase, small subunit [Variovorax sp. OK202]SFC93359.1 3-isopropylmalate dehydratase, small subunit [Variovorax sp. OK212]